MTGQEAKRRLKEKVAELERLSLELYAILDELPIPTPEEFEAIREQREPWTLEAYMAALIRNVDFLVDQARVTIDDYGRESKKSLELLWKRKSALPVPIERSLRYLIAERSGESIPASVTERLYYNPSEAESLMARLVVDLLRQK
jgi:hypothetical protein